MDYHATDCYAESIMTRDHAVQHQSRRTPAAMSIEEFVALSGTSRTTAYDEIKRSGEIAGIRAIRIGKRILLSRSRVYEVFGIQA